MLTRAFERLYPMNVYVAFGDDQIKKYYFRMMRIVSDLEVMALGEVEIFELKELEESNFLD